MLTSKKLSLVALLALGVAGPGIAAADDDRRADRRDERSRAGVVSLGQVGTHTHDAEDYLAVATWKRLDQLVLRATDGSVAIDGVRIQFADGRSEYAPVQRHLQTGEAFVIDLPGRGARVEMLVLDYGNQGPYWRARETAHLEVLGVTTDARGRGRYRPQYQPAQAYQPAYQPAQAYQPGYQPAPVYQPGYQPAQTYQPGYQPAPVYQPRDSDGFVIRGGVQVRIR